MGAHDLAIAELTGTAGASPGSAIRVLGIDLGTTNTTVTEITWSGDPADTPQWRVRSFMQQTYTGPHRSHLIPSVVYAEPDGGILVGEGARRIPVLGRPHDYGRNLFRDTKNEIGTDEEYRNAVSGLRTPKAVAAQLLRYIHDEVVEDGGYPDHVVITVPASFFGRQRTDTLEAAQEAGFDTTSLHLLEEPVAAFLHAHLHSGADSPPSGRTAVFDFGGGTCDIALLEAQQDDGSWRFALAGLSRYTRLGGSDIDRAVAYGILLPQALEQNGLEPGDLEADDIDSLLDALEPTADDLKQKLVGAMTRAERMGRDPRSAGPVKVPRKLTLELPGKSIGFVASLALDAFERELHPFIDPENPRIRTAEFVDSQSIFAPLTDVIERSGWRTSQIDNVLAVGGSSFLPQVQEALRAFFATGAPATVHTPQSAEHVQSEISVGAGLQALSYAVRGRPIMTATAPEEVALVAEDADGRTKKVTLIEQGAPLPMPFTSNNELRLPELDDGVRLEVTRGDIRLGVKVVQQPPASWRTGSPARLSATYDENQVLQVELTAEDDDASVVLQFERPWSYTQSADSPRARIRQLTLDLENVATARQRASVRTKLISLFRETRQHQRARSQVHSLMREASPEGADMAVALHWKGLLAMDTGNDRDAIDSLKESARLHWDGSPLFSLALHLRRRGRHQEALEALETALEIERTAETLTMYGLELRKVGRSDEGRRALQEALASFGNPEGLAGPFSASWMIEAASAMGDDDLADRARNRHRELSAPKEVATGRPLVLGGRP